MKRSYDGAGFSLERLFRAPPEQVFAAWTEPDRVVRWLCPYGLRLSVEQMEVRPGGRYRWRMQGDSGENNLISGEYLVVEPPRTLEFTWTVRLLRSGADHADEVDDSRVRVTLAAAGSGTRLRLTHSHLPSASAVQGHRRGWEQCVANLAQGDGSAA